MVKIKLYRIRDIDEDGIEFWSALKPLDKSEKLLKTKTFKLPLREGFYGKDYLSQTDVDSIEEEVK